MNKLPRQNAEITDRRVFYNYFERQAV